MQVKKAIWAGDQIRLKPYRVGGGHGKWHDSAYDCSGSVSYVLHAAGLLKVSEDSGEMESWGQKGLGPVDHRLHQPRATPSSRSPGSAWTPRGRAIRTRRPARAPAGGRS